MRPRSALLLALVYFTLPVAQAQQPKVLAPHVPVDPKVVPAQPRGKPLHQSAAGGLWMTGPNMKSSLYLKNTMKTNSVIVTPAFYLSNGVRCAAAPVTLEPSGTSIVDVNQALAQQGIAPYATLYGYAEIEYQWPWAPVTASIRNVDAQNSLIFIYPLQPPPQATPPGSGTAGAPSTQHLEGLWWKHEKDVTGFLALANVTGHPIHADVQVTNDAEAQMATYQLTIAAHETKMLALDQLKAAPSPTGGIYLVHDGEERGLAVSGGLEDQAVGYSARLPLLSSPKPGPNGASPSSIQLDFAELGLMTGSADPMMNFPYGTTFTPYSVIRNISDQAATVTPTVWWMSGGAAKSARLSTLKIAPHHTLNLDAPALLNAAGLKNFNGSANLVLDTEAELGALVLASGSVDQTNTYVFEVMPRAVGEGASQGLCYWSTGNGDDTMVTLWNPADEAQDFVFTLFYTGGHYLYPIHLEPRATHTFNVSEIIHSGLPDSEGNVIPVAVQDGSAELAGVEGEQQHILVGMDTGVYNVRKAICGNNCVVCNGVVDSFIVDDPFGVPVGSSHQETFYMRYNTGAQYNLNSHSSWSTSNAAIATVGSGLVSGVSSGLPTISAQDFRYEPAYNSCAVSLSSCLQKTSGVIPSGSSGGNVTPTVTFGYTPVVPLAKTATITATVSGNTNNSNINLTISTTSGTGQAIFLDTGTATKTITASADCSSKVCLRAAALTTSNLPPRFPWREGRSLWPRQPLRSLRRTALYQRT